MNSFQQVAAAINATTIELPDRFLWLGAPGPHPLPKAKAVLSLAQSRSFLLSTLAMHLYRHFYCTGGVVRSADAPMPGGDAPWFVNELRAANTGRGGWQNGWRLLEELPDGGAIANLDGLSVWLSRDQWKREAASSDEASVSVKRPSEYQARQPGFFIVESDACSNATEWLKLVRVYWHVRVDAAAGLIRRITARFNLADLPFGLKLPCHPGDYTRFDTAVLYLPRDRWGDAAPLICETHQAVAPGLVDGVPAFTKHLARGLGVAEGPESGESFGMARCRLLAEGIVLGAEQRAEDGQTKLEFVRARFERAGVDLEQPFLEPGGHDCYTLAPPMLIRRSKRQEPAPRLAHTRDEQSSRFEDAAVEIGARLCREAVWHEDRCNWLGSPAGPPTQASAPRRLVTLGADVYSGSAGIAFFLANLGAVRGDGCTIDTALGAARRSLVAVSQLPRERRIGLYTGASGVAVTAARVGLQLDSTNLTQMARRLMRSVVERRPPSRAHDILDGDAGLILALLEMTRLLGDDEFSSMALGIASELLDAAKVDDDELTWLEKGAGDGTALTGYSHGSTGIALAFRVLHSVSGDNRWIAAAEASDRYEERWFDPVEGNWRDLRGYVSRNPYMTAWCHGAPGIALARSGIDGLGTARAHESVMALATTRRAVETALRQNIDDFSLCHGVAGLADILLEVAPENHGWDAPALARQVGMVGLARYGDQQRPWPCGVADETPSLLLGLAGIGNFYLRLSDPRVPSPLGLGMPRPSPIEGLPLDSVPTVHVGAERPDTRATAVSGLVSLRTGMGNRGLASLLRVGMRANGFQPSGRELRQARVDRWSTGRKLRDRSIPQSLPGFADLEDYLALAEQDPHLWESLPFMLAFGQEQGRVFGRLANADELSRDSLRACAFFSALLSVFDYVADECGLAAEVFDIEADGLNALFGDSQAAARLASAYLRTDDNRVKFVCALFSMLGADLQRAIAGVERSVAVDRLRELVGELFAAERTVTTQTVGSLNDLNELASVGRTKSVLPFVTLAAIASLGPSKATALAWENLASIGAAVGEVVGETDDLVDLAIDLERGCPSPVVAAAVDLAVRRRHGVVDDVVLVEIAGSRTRDLMGALDKLRDLCGSAEASRVFTFANLAVARWFGWEENEPSQPRGAQLKAQDVVQCLGRLFVSGSLPEPERARLEANLQALGEQVLASSFPPEPLERPHGTHIPTLEVQRC